jgi:hypothetical protein
MWLMWWRKLLEWLRSNMKSFQSMENQEIVEFVGYLEFFKKIIFT